MKIPVLQVSCPECGKRIKVKAVLVPNVSDTELGVSVDVDVQPIWDHASWHTWNEAW